jgi:hypothetical protein
MCWKHPRQTLHSISENEKGTLTQCQQTTRSNTPAGHTRLYTKYLQKTVVVIYCSLKSNIYILTLHQYDQNVTSSNNISAKNTFSCS